MSVFADLRPLSYDLIMADPPWRFKTWSENGQDKGRPYDLMDLTAIKAMPVSHLGRGDCILWLWATNPMMPQALEVVNAWGFKYVTMGVWVKRTKKGKLGFGTGYRLRCASEPFIIATLGKPQSVRDIRTVIEGPLREDSRKPDEAYAAAGRMFPAAVRKLDLFSRESRPGWDVWGNETGKFDEVPARHSTTCECGDCWQAMESGRVRG